MEARDAPRPSACDGGIIALGRDGSLAMPFNSRGMYRAWVREGETAQTRIFADC